MTDETRPQGQVTVTVNYSRDVVAIRQNKPQFPFVRLYHVDYRRQLLPWVLDDLFLYIAGADRDWGAWVWWYARRESTRRFARIALRRAGTLIDELERLSLATITEITIRDHQVKMNMGGSGMSRAEIRSSRLPRLLQEYAEELPSPHQIL